MTWYSSRLGSKRFNILGLKSVKPSSPGEKSLVAKKIKGIPTEVETELLRHASSEMPTKKEVMTSTF
jgi:hypothetical protein